MNEYLNIKERIRFLKSNKKFIEIEKKRLSGFDDDLFYNTSLFIESKRIFLQIKEKHPELFEDADFYEKGIIDIAKSKLEKGLLIDVFKSGRYYYVFYLTPNNIRMKIFIAKTFDRYIGELNKGIKKNDARLFSLYKDSLSQYLFDEWLIPKTANRLIIIPYGEFFELPFEVLTLPKGKKYLIEEMSVTYNYSLLIWLNKTRTNRIVYDYYYAGFASGNDKGEESLKLALTEIKETKKRISGKGKKTYNNKRLDNNREFFPNPPSAKFLHIASHFIFEPKEPIKSYLLLNNKKIYLDELIYKAKFNSETIIFNSCNSGVTDLSSNDFHTLGKILLYHNTFNFIGNIWRVPDRAAYRLIDSFFDNYLRGESLSQALRVAKVEMIKSNQYSAPFFWGGLRLFGVD